MYAILVFVVVLMLIPFVLVFSGSFKTQGEFIADPGAWFPKTFNFDNYVTLFTQKGFGGYLINSVIVATIAVLANVIFGAMAGYALAKLKFKGRQLMFVAVMGAMTVPYVAVFVPQFFIIVQLGLVNTLAGIALPLLVMPISVFIMRQFAYSVPDELLEAARMDGAGEIRTFATVFIPLAGPALATVSILSFLYSWNYFLWPLIVAQSQNVYTAPIGLAVASQASNTTAFGLLLAGAVVVLLPVLILFLFLQRYFIQGVATAGLK